ncbi:MAG: hypothetical protein V3576_00050 [Candidatus Cloacimonadota bacterium]|jgi:hypothetical protein
MDKTNVVQRKLTDLFWDYNHTEERLKTCLLKNDPKDPLTISLYNRILLSTPNWYDVIEMLSAEQLRIALSERVIKTIYSPSLRERFRFARTILFPD